MGNPVYLEVENEPKKKSNPIDGNKQNKLTGESYACANFICWWCYKAKLNRSPANPNFS